MKKTLCLFLIAVSFASNAATLDPVHAVPKTMARTDHAAACRTPSGHLTRQCRSDGSPRGTPARKPSAF